MEFADVGGGDFHSSSLLAVLQPQPEVDKECLVETRPTTKRSMMESEDKEMKSSPKKSGRKPKETPAASTPGAAPPKANTG
jgi:hypothetical protein